MVLSSGLLPVVGNGFRSAVSAAAKGVSCKWRLAEFKGCMLGMWQVPYHCLWYLYVAELTRHFFPTRDLIVPGIQFRNLETIF
jgi:hypothetical protein